MLAIWERCELHHVVLLVDLCAGKSGECVAWGWCSQGGWLTAREQCTHDIRYTRVILTRYHQMIDQLRWSSLECQYCLLATVGDLRYRCELYHVVLQANLCLEVIHASDWGSDRGWRMGCLIGFIFVLANCHPIRHTHHSLARRLSAIYKEEEKYMLAFLWNFPMASKTFGRIETRLWRAITQASRPDKEFAYGLVYTIGLITDHMILLHVMAIHTCFVWILMWKCEKNVIKLGLFLQKQYLYSTNIYFFLSETIKFINFSWNSNIFLAKSLKKWF